jgi:hypothetical protein
MDPLRPFADLIRSLWRTQTKSVERTAGAGATSSQAAEEPAPPKDARADLQQKLRARLTPSVLADSARARTVFVETVLIWELGDRLSTDPSFHPVVDRVAQQLAEQPALADRLQATLVALAENRAV